MLQIKWDAMRYVRYKKIIIIIKSHHALHQAACSYELSMCGCYGMRLDGMTLIYGAWCQPLCRQTSVLLTCHWTAQSALGSLHIKGFEKKYVLIISCTPKSKSMTSYFYLRAKHSSAAAPFIRLNPSVSSLPRYPWFGWCPRFALQRYIFPKCGYDPYWIGDKDRCWRCVGKTHNLSRLSKSFLIVDI